MVRLQLYYYVSRSELNKATSCRGLPQAQVLEILNDVVSALGYLHNRRIIHRDLKPENVVMKAEEARLVYKLIDLGYAKELGVSSLARSFVGTLQYVAPELFLEHDYTRSVDYWSLGLLCHEIVTGQFGLERRFHYHGKCLLELSHFYDTIKTH